MRTVIKLNILTVKNPTINKILIWNLPKPIFSTASDSVYVNSPESVARRKKMSKNTFYNLQTVDPDYRGHSTYKLTKISGKLRYFKHVPLYLGDLTTQLGENGWFSLSLYPESGCSKKTIKLIQDCMNFDFITFQWGFCLFIFVVLADSFDID